MKKLSYIYKLHISSLDIIQTFFTLSNVAKYFMPSNDTTQNIS